MCSGVPPDTRHTYSPLVREGSSLRLLLLLHVCIPAPLSSSCSIAAALKLQPLSLTLPITLYKRTTPGWDLREMPQPGFFSIASGDKSQVPFRWLWVLACCSFAVQPREVIGMNPVHSTHHEGGLLVQGSCFFLFGSSSC